jgi:uncharacterized protein (DUF305 family)
MAVLVLLLGLLVAVPAALADGPVAGRAGRAEVRYLEGMIDHHQMALDMAQHCLSMAESEEIRTLCQNVIAAQSREIEIMRGWLLLWYGIDYKPMSMMDMMNMMHGSGMMMGGMMGGAASGAQEGQHDQHNQHGGQVQQTPVPQPGMGMMMSDPPMMMGMMSGLGALTGREYEIAWLEAMIDHHDDALHMSERVLRHAEHEELRELAQQIIDDQTAEIDMMEALITELGAEA